MKQTKKKSSAPPSQSKFVNIQEEPRYTDSILYEVAVFEKGKLVGLFHSDGAYNYYLPSHKGYSYEIAMIILRSKRAAAHVKKGQVLAVIQRRRLNCTITWRMPV